MIISGITIRNGQALYGAGILNGGVLTVSRSILVGNVAFERCVDRCSSISSGRGGAVFNTGTMIISNSTLTQNSASACRTIFLPMGRQIVCSGVGGGIWNNGTLTINNDTLSANDVGHQGSVGGGVFNVGGILTVNNSTVSMNSGGGIFNEDTNGFGFTQGTATLQNAIVANKGVNCEGPLIISMGYNLSSNGSCHFSNTGDRNNTNPKLGPLQNNGGPTQTMALLPGSPAIDAGNPSGCTDGHGHLFKTDQRGKPRPDPEDTGGCDMGAYESQGD